MFALRTEHMEAFAQSAREAFEDRMVLEVYRSFPDHYEELGEEGVRARIRKSSDRAGRYGITALPDVDRFVRFTFSIGPDFDTARRTAWVRPILEDTTVPPGQRLDRIRDEARRRRIAERRGAE